MQVFPKPVALVLFVTLGALVGARGVVPAMSRLTSDFPSYFTAAKIVAEGGDVGRLYDIPWFQEQMRRYQVGEPSLGKFAPFPPPTALLLVPLTPLAPLDALRVMTGLSVLCLLGSILLLARTLAWGTLDAAVFVLLSGWGILSVLRLGQPYIVVSGFCILGYYAYLRGRPWVAGACLGLFAPIKYFPLAILTCLAFRRNWRLLTAAMLTILAVTVLSIAVLGFRIHVQFLTSILGNHLIAKLSMQDPFSVGFQSFDTLFRRLFVFDATANPHPWVAAPWLSTAALLLTKAGILVVALATLVRLVRTRGPIATGPAVGLVGIMTLLLAPASASYHLLLLWLPVGLLVDFFLRERALTSAYLVLASYALLGLFPYWLVPPFEGRGGLSVLAYPRLFLLLAMFAACVHGLWTRAQAPHGTGADALVGTLTAQSPR